MRARLEACEADEDGWLEAVGKKQSFESVSRIPGRLGDGCRAGVVRAAAMVVRCTAAAVLAGCLLCRGGKPLFGCSGCSGCTASRPRSAGWFVRFAICCFLAGFEATEATLTGWRIRLADRRLLADFGTAEATLADPAFVCRELAL